MLSNKTNRTDEIYSAAVNNLSSALTLEALRETMGLVKNVNFLIAITCRPEFYDYLINLKEIQKIDSGPFWNDLIGADVYKITSQKENIKYWYNDQKEELNEYLKNNI